MSSAPDERLKRALQEDTDSLERAAHNDEVQKLADKLRLERGAEFRASFSPIGYATIAPALRSVEARIKPARGLIARVQWSGKEDWIMFSLWRSERWATLTFSADEKKMKFVVTTRLSGTAAAIPPVELDPEQITSEDTEERATAFVELALPMLRGESESG